MKKIESPGPLEAVINRHVLIVSAVATLQDIKDLLSQPSIPSTDDSGQLEKTHHSQVQDDLSILVVDQARLVGMITAFDLLKILWTESKPNEIKVSSVMMTPVITQRLAECQDIHKLLSLFRHYQITAIPILDHQDYPIGIVTLIDLMQLDEIIVPSQLGHAQLFENQSLLMKIAKHIQESDSLQSILDVTVQEIRQLLNTDRVIAYRFDPDWSGTVLAESINNESLSLLDQVITDPHFGQAMVEPYKKGRVQVTDTIEVGLTECHKEFLEKLRVKAIIVVPILQGEELWGLLAAHECSQSRVWERSSVSVLQQLSTHISIAIQQADFITQLHQSNQQLEEKVAQRTWALSNSEKHLNTIVSSVADGILILNLEGIIIFANLSAVKMFGIPLEKFLGLRMGIPTDLSNRFEVSYLAGYEKIQPGDVEVTLIEWNDHQAYLVTLHDITRRREIEDNLQRINIELARATRLKDEFLAAMSHELRTPLNAILGMTEGLQDLVFGSINESQQKALQTIARSGSHLLELINDILDVAKIESGNVELECAATEVSHLCQSSLVFVKEQALKKRIELEVRVPRYIPDLLVDERRIRQVLINLLNNAVKFTPAGGHITLEAFQPPPDASAATLLRIVVADTGIGIAPEDIPKLFQPFIQIDSALNRQYAGTGLGLALVKRIVELHGGMVGLTSVVGQGSSFMIELPYVRSVSSTAIPTTPIQPSRAEQQPEILNIGTNANRAPLILITDDNEANLMTTSSYLEAKGHRVLLARNGREALSLLEHHVPDLVLMDIQMPDLDGLEVIRQIRKIPSTIPVIALTALAMPDDRQKCLDAGANEYLSKPVRLKVLSERIRQHLASLHEI